MCPCAPEARRHAGPAGLTSFIGELLVDPSIDFVWRALRLKPGPSFLKTGVEDADALAEGGGVCAPVGAPSRNVVCSFCCWLPFDLAFSD
jgi:hypothetical protein